MLSELSYKAPVMALGPIPDSDPFARDADYWEARKEVYIPIKQYFEWLNVNIWTCTLTISNSFTETNPDGTDTTNTLTSCSKVFEVNYRRENKAPGYTYSGDIINAPYISGQIYQTTDPNFPYGYQEQGPQPADWWMKQRSNFLTGNHQRAYFNTTINWTNYQNPVGEGYLSFAQYSSLAFGLSINPGVDTYYDPDTKTVWPGLVFESDSRDSRHNYTVNWPGTLGGDPYSTVSLSVDGVSIPSEVYWPNYGSSTNLSISIAWTKGATREL
jgi:hypothetical protein